MAENKEASTFVEALFVEGSGEISNFLEDFELICSKLNLFSCLLLFWSFGL
ncbi:hypothetical protein SAMN05421788_113157 [Filimonas lacunae]|uniref:Uncharacterized protein n=1 Tax=Filimonas lacunae TaxID=477680 RepID=A0A1N7RFE3_9BACT|nr:hypothetical protein SAMN05421788_113157 [Filimonas lacunae]